MICEDALLRYYNPDQETTIECDASSTGLGATLKQEGAPITYASRALTKTEQNYSQIEKELLAIVFATKHFQLYIIGKTTKVQSDHKPLEDIFKKNLCEIPKRLQKMMM